MSDLNKTQCEIHMRRGWRCTRFKHYMGPCALVPVWWNIPGRWKFRGRS